MIISEVSTNEQNKLNAVSSKALRKVYIGGLIKSKPIESSKNLISSFLEDPIVNLFCKKNEVDVFFNSGMDRYFSGCCYGVNYKKLPSNNLFSKIKYLFTRQKSIYEVFLCDIYNCKSREEIGKIAAQKKYLLTDKMFNEIYPEKK